MPAVIVRDCSNRVDFGYEKGFYFCFQGFPLIQLHAERQNGIIGLANEKSLCLFVAFSRISGELSFTRFQ